jgi:hypothetical protein
MSSCEMSFPDYDARSNRGEIRWELFLHREVKDVLLTPHDDTLWVVYSGDPDPIEWAATLNQAGFPTPQFEWRPRDAGTQGSSRAAA